MFHNFSRFRLILFNLCCLNIYHTSFSTFRSNITSMQKKIQFSLYKKNCLSKRVYIFFFFFFLSLFLVFLFIFCLFWVTASFIPSVKIFVFFVCFCFFLFLFYSAISFRQDWLADAHMSLNSRMSRSTVFMPSVRLPLLYLYAPMYECNCVLCGMYVVYLSVSELLLLLVRKTILSPLSPI